MKTLKLIIVLIVLGVASIHTFAQSIHANGTPAEIAKKQGEDWQRKLGLTDDEKTKFVEAKTIQLTKLQGIERNKENKAARRAYAVDFEKSVQAAFTAEHFVAWKNTREEMRKKRLDKKGQKDTPTGSTNVENGEVD